MMFLLFFVRLSRKHMTTYTNSSELSIHIPDGPPYLEYAFPELRIGCAEYTEGPTGVTVFHFPHRCFAAVDCRGGSPATSLTDVLRVNHGKFVSGIVFSGGSAYGLEAASGVTGTLTEGRIRFGSMGRNRNSPERRSVRFPRPG